MIKYTEPEKTPTALFLVYSTHATKTDALDALGHYITTGEITERMVYRTGIREIDNHWCVVVKLTGAM